MTRFYSVFGLRVRSEVELPELPVLPSDDEHDVAISWGRIERPPGEDGWLWTANQATMIQFDGVARFAVREGRSIRVDPHPRAEARDIRVYLLGSAMGLLLHQRGLLPLHANAIEVGGRAAAFVGSSGSGKSTLAGWFSDEGIRVIADDVCAVGFDSGGSPVVSPGLQRLRLWRDALERTGRDPAAYSLSFTADGSREKYDVPLTSQQHRQGSAPLAALYQLDCGDQFGIEPLEGVEAAEVVFANTYRGLLIENRNRLRHWQSCVALARKVPIMRVRRVWGFEAFDDQNRQLLAHLAAIAN